MRLHLVHDIFEFLFKPFVYLRIILLNEHRLFLSQQVGDAIEGRSQSFVKELVGIIHGRSRLCGLLLLVDLFWLKSDFAHVLVHCLHEIIIDIRAILVTDLPQHPQAALPIKLVWYGPKNHKVCCCLLWCLLRILLPLKCVKLLNSCVLFIHGLQECVANLLNLFLLQLS